MFKVTIKPKSSFITDLNSSTIFGAACWAINDLYGEEILKEVFEDDTAFAVSNAFISGYIPSGNSGDNKLRNTNTNEEIHNTIQVYRVDHCQIDRNSNSSNKQWVSYEHFETRELDVYVSSSIFDIKEVEEIFKLMLIKGLGKARNKGKGQFEFKGITNVDIAELGDKNPNGYMVISDYIPNEKDSTIGKYSARVINRTTAEGKKCAPVYVINAGSKFAGKPTREIIGKLQYDDNTGTYLSGRAIILPISI